MSEVTNLFFRKILQSGCWAFLCLFLCSCSPKDTPPATVRIGTEMDFLLRMEEGKCTVSNPEYGKLTTGQINDIVHWGFFEHAPCRIEFPDIDIGPQPQLSFSIGILPHAWENSGDGVRFQVSAVLPSQETRILYSQYIDPKTNPDHRRWLPQQVAVEGIENVSATLVFETFPGEDENDTDADFDFAFWANPRLISQGREALHRKRTHSNILLITMDTTRADFLGCYGNSWIQTPVLDRLASEGILFERAYTASYHTNPSHVSILTSLSPFAHGVLGNEHKLPGPFPGLPQILKECGYTNLAIISAYHLNNFMEGLGPWFDVYDKPKPMQILPGSIVTSRAIQRLEEVRDQPFFYWVHYYDPHQPYRALGEYHRMYYAGDPADPTHRSMEKARFPAEWDIHSPDSWLHVSRDVDYFEKEHGAEVTYMDAEIGRLLETLRRLRLDENTLIIAVADHGESFGEHGVYFDHWTPFDTDLHVPLILSYPAKLPRGKRVSTPVSTLDIAPTILDILGESKNYLAKNLFEGRSLRASWKNRSGLAPRIDATNGPYFINSTVWDDRYKLIWELQRTLYHDGHQTFSNRVWIYDRQSDPGEQQPAACFYWGDTAGRRDSWIRERNKKNTIVTGNRIQFIRSQALSKKVPTAEELRGWFQEENGRDTVRDEYRNDADFYQRAAALLEKARRNVNAPSVWEKMKDSPDILGPLGKEPAYLQPTDPAMKDFLRSLGYAGN